MNELLSNISFILIGYSLGCITFGYYIVRYALGNDVRNTGSGSLGATNVGRLLGSNGFLLTLVGDMGKGALAVCLAKWGGVPPVILALVVVAAVAGHIWPAQLGFNGGKGVATVLGALVVYDPALVLASTLVYLPFFVIFKDRAVAGLIVFMCLPVLAVMISRPLVEIMTCFVLGVLLVWAHRGDLIEKCRWCESNKSL